ncbi:hypothetical protein Cob_v008079 [Colletotrichum orbiculare MAFF 240422]|uniref:Uncharacterized protein n=1 Tax=Colletotrichum orbiculare (strain 104-T / ATCC 96160 / CBS 514.97 / LARS 414 / MAFF 240422) TaxID=1213857 RepID=A0A484FKL3_COLOR|nr:hypothetical protein Cob_v008079 [Colletotrichum orbiculare MAFF 240422]
MVPRVESPISLSDLNVASSGFDWLCIPRCRRLRKTHHEEMYMSLVQCCILPNTSYLSFFWPSDHAAIVPRGSTEIPSKEQLGIRYRAQGDNYFITGPSGFFVDANCDERTKTIEIPWVNNPSRNIGSRAVVANLWKYELRWDGLSGVRFTHINNERALASMDKAWQVARDNDELGDADKDGRLLVMYSEEAFDGLRTKGSNPLGYMIYNMLSVYEDFDNYYVRSIEIGTRRNPYMHINIRKYT